MSRSIKLALFLGDIALLYAALAATLLVRYPGGSFREYFATHTLPFSIVFILWIVVFFLADLYHARSMRSERTLGNAFFGAVLIAGIISIIAFYLFGEFFQLTPKTNLLLFVAFFSTFGYFWRRIVLAFLSGKGVGIVLIGNSPRLEEVRAHLAKHPSSGYRTVAHLSSISEDHDFLKRMHELHPSMVVIDGSAAHNEHARRALYALLPFEITILGLPDFYEMIFEKVPLDALEDEWFLSHIITRRPFYDATKRIIDFALAFALFALLVVPALLIAGLISLTSRGPAIYAQKRMGKNGQTFTLYKFRSMTDGHSGPLWTETNDSRLTPVGKFLRFTHADEIPQLLNILRGNISFTGPRPERVELAEAYSQIPYYEMRHVVKPGLTGWAQINYKPSASLDEARAKLEYDIYYVKNRSFLLDMLIILRTIRYVFTSHEA